MKLNKAIMWVLTGLTLIAFNAFLLFFVGDNLTGFVVFLAFFGLAILMMLIGVIGGWLGIAREKLGNRIEERRKEKYYKTHPEEK